MILALSFLALLLATNAGAAGIKGGRRIIQEPAVIQDVSPPHIHLGKGGGGGTLHHSAVVQDPLSGNPVLVEKVSRLGSGGGIKGGGGIRGGLGAGSAQFALSDGPFGQRRLYRIGQSQYPFGLLGSDYYSYPASLLTAPRRVLRRKTVASPNLSGLRPVGFGSGRKGGVLVDPTTSQFSIGDAQVKTGGYGLRRNVYRSGLSSVPYGLMGLDYYSYPKQLLTQRRLVDDFGLGQTRILSGGSAFTAGDSQIRGPIISPVDQQVAVLGDGLGDGFGQRKITTTTVTKAADPLSVALGQGPVTQTTVTKSVGGGGLGGLRGGQIILSGGQGFGGQGFGGQGFGGLRRVKSRPAVVVDGGFGQRQVAVASPLAQAQIISAPAPIVQAPVFQAPVQVVQTPVVSAAPIRRVLTQTRRPGEVFLQQVARPRVAQRIATLSRPAQVVVPVSQQRVAVGPQIISSPVIAAPRQVVVASRPQVISQVKTSPGLIGRRVFGGSPRMVYVDGGNRFLGIDIIGGSRIGDPRFGYGQLPYSAGRFANLGGLSQARIPVRSFSSFDGQGSIDAGQTLLSPAPVTVLSSSPFRKSSPLLAAASPVAKTTITQAAPLGFAGIGSGLGAPSKTITQEEVVGPHGDRQVVTTVTKSDSNRLVGSKIGGLAVGGLGGIGQGPSQIVTQEEVVGPAGDPQILTTVTNTGSGLGSSKIGGLAAGSSLGFAGIGSGLGAPSKTITQEEVVGPHGDRQVVTTVTKSDSNRLVGSKIGGLAVGGLGGIGKGSKVVTQEEVIGPAGDSQILTTVTNTGSGLGSSKIGGLAAGSPLGFAGLGSGFGAPSKTITQEEVVGPHGDRQVVTTVTKSDSNHLTGSKIGGLAVGGLAGIGQGSSKVVTQEEVIGPAGDSQILTTVTNTGSGLGSSKIGGLAAGSPLGFAGLGSGFGAPSKTITQEEVVGPHGDRQVVTTVTKSDSNLFAGSKIGRLAVGGLAGVGQGSGQVVTQEEVIGPAGDSQILTTVSNTGSGLGSSKIGGFATGGPLGLTAIGQGLAQEIAQDPIETTLIQEALGDSLLSSVPSVSIGSPLSQTVQSLVDPLGSGQSQVSVDDVIAQSPFSGLDPTVSVSQISQAPLGISSGSLGDSIVQQNIADAVVQESISSGIGGIGSLLGYEPRVSFLSQYPYDVPDSQLLQSVLTSRPVFQQQQEVEQILVK